MSVLPQYILTFSIYFQYSPKIDNTTMSTESPQERQQRHEELVGETVEVGLMFASKAFVQLIVNPIVGPLTHK